MGQRGPEELDEVAARVARLELTLLEVVTALGMVVGDLALHEELALATAGTAERALEAAWQTLLGVPGPQDADVVAGELQWGDAARLAEIAPSTLRRAMDETGASVGAVYAIDASEARLVASYGYPDGVMDAFRTFALDAELPVALAARECRLLWFAERSEILESYPHLEAAHEETERALGRTAVQGAVMPLLAGDRVSAVVILGFTIDRTSPDPARLRAVRNRMVEALDGR